MRTTARDRRKTFLGSSPRPHFRSLEGRIDAAIERARALTRTRGILSKEPSLCHGVLGNALVLPRGDQRNCFLSLATPEKVEEIRRQNRGVFAEGGCPSKDSVLMCYNPSAVWTWLVFERPDPRFIMYNDV